MSEFYTNVDSFGDDILVRYVDSSGNDNYRREKYMPTLYTPSEEPTGFKDLFGNHMMPRVYDNIRDMRQALRDAREYGLVLNGMDDPVIQFINTRFKNDMEFDRSKIVLWNIDIEVKADSMPSPMDPRWPIDQLCIRDRNADRYYSFSLYDWDKEKAHDRAKPIADRVVHRKYDDEKSLLLAFIDFWRSSFPHIVTGWNSDGFDFPYMVERIKLLFGESMPNRLSPFGITNTRTSRDAWGQDQMVADIKGVTQLDYLDLYRKYVLSPRPNYRLDTIGEIEAGRHKIQYDGKLNELSEKDPQTYVDYNIIDTEVVEAIDDKRDLISLAMFVAFHASVSPESTSSPVKTWDARLFKVLNAENKVVPMLKRGQSVAYEGGYVKEPMIRRIGWSMSFDFTSLYPMIIQQANISFETLKHFDENPPPFIDFVNGVADTGYPDLSITPIGAYYCRDNRGVIPIEIEKMFNDRKASQGEMRRYRHLSADTKDSILSEEYRVLSVKFNTRQEALKVLLNSLYGALANEYFRYFDWVHAAAITSFGRLAIQWGERKLNIWMNELLGTTDVDYVIAIDTDSLYVDFDPLIKAKKREHLGLNENADWLNAIAEKVIQPLCDKWFTELQEFMGSPLQKMHFDRENISPAAFWTAKKRYAMAVIDNEGFRFPEDAMDIKHMGLETKRGSTPAINRDGLLECIKIILTGTESELHKFVRKYECEYYRAPLDEICQVSTANNLDKYSDGQGYPMKGCPGHLKGALMHNRLSAKYSFDPILPGDKISFVALRQPNPLDVQENSAYAWSSGSLIPIEIRDSIDEYVDRDEMYRKNFIGTLSNWCVINGISHEETTTVDDFFS